MKNSLNFCVRKFGLPVGLILDRYLLATSARHVFLGFRQQQKNCGSGPLLENFLGGIGLAFTNKNGCSRLHTVQWATCVLVRCSLLSSFHFWTCIRIV